MSALAAGQLISDRYRLDRRIAVGGMGEVWEAEDTRLGRSVAVKVLKADLSDDPEFLHRFRIEARTVASLDHSGIASVHDYGEDDGPAGGGRTAYLVMELVRGEPLSSRIGRGPIPADEALDILEQAGRALQAAHERGFVHRDVKPGNILLRTDGVVKLTDFGIAKAADAAPVTRSGMVMGTAHYIAPEQASGEEAGPAGDVYSLGIVGYECLAGVRPFRAESAVAVAMMQVRDDPPPLTGELPERVRELISSVLVKDPARRYADGGEFADAVAAVRRGHRPPPPGIPAPTGAAPGFGLAPPPRSEPEPRDETVRRSGPARPEDDPSRRPTTSQGGPGAGGGTPPPSRPATGPQRVGEQRSGEQRAGEHGTRPWSGPQQWSGPMPVPPPHGGPAAARTPGPVRPGEQQRPAGPPGQQGPDSPPRPAPARPPVRRDTADHRPDRAPDQHPSGPLDLTPRRSGRGRAWLAAVFVILTLAAVLLAVLILRESPGGPWTGSLGQGPGTVTGREAHHAGPAAGFAPLAVAGTRGSPEDLR